MSVRFPVHAGILVASLFALCISGQSLAGTFYDFAQVLESTPVLAQERVPVRRAVCVSRDLPAPDEEAGWLHERNASLGLADWIGQDAAGRAATVNDCSERVEFEIRERVVAFDVRYRYAGREYMRRMEHDPGRRLRVRVDMQTP